MPAAATAFAKTAKPGPQLLTALLTDLVDSTRLVSEFGDQKAFEHLQHHDRLARDLLAEHDGSEIDKSDGFLLLFQTPADAVAFALHYHAALRTLSMETGVQWRARVGIYLGELFVHENSPSDIARGAKALEVEGLAKALAARLMGLAQGGQTLLGTAAFDLAQRQGVAMEDVELAWLAHGHYRFKGSEGPLEVFEVGVVGQAPLMPPPDSDKAKRDISDDERMTLGWRPGPGNEVPHRAPWRLTRKLGAGGFGEVWLGEHPQTGGNKVFKFCHDAERLRSLKREVTVLRLLNEALGDRQDIVRIIDWQLDSAPYFIEFEYIDGGDLMAWAGAKGGLDQIAQETRLEIVAQIADALAAAHSIGVLHKDIKPGNILIREGSNGRPQALLTDFGIGLVTDRRQLLAHGITLAGLTEFLDTPGTGGSQLYMAPETLQGKAASIQADIYALGVVLYELAAGQFKPLAPGWQRDISCELLTSDIEQLVDGDPSRRPANAARVAKGLRELPRRRARLAAEREAAAEAEATRLALARAHRRRRWSLGIGAAMAVVLAIVSYSAWQTALARDEASLRRDRAERLIGFMLDDLRGRLTKVGRLDVMDSVTDAAMDYFKGIPTAQLNDTDLAGRSKVLYQIGDTRLSRGDFEGARQAMAESLNLAQALANRAPDDSQRQFDLAQSEYWVGYVDFRGGQFNQALEHFQRYLEIAQWLVAKDQTRQEWQAELGYAYINLGTVLEAKGDYSEAVANYRNQLNWLSKMLEHDPANATLQKSMATSHDKLGLVMEIMGQLSQAQQHYQQEQDILHQLLVKAPSDAVLTRQMATSQYFSARLLLQMGEAATSAEQVNFALQATESLLTRDPANTRWRRDHVVMLQLAGQIDLQIGQPASAMTRLEKARTIATPILESFADLAPTLDLLEAQIDFAQNDLMKAEAVASRAAHAFEGELPGIGADSREELHAEALLWLMLARGGKIDDDSLQAALSKLQARQSPSLRNRAMQARILLASGKINQARPIAEQLLATGYRYGPFAKECAAAGINISRSSSLANTPN